LETYKKRKDGIVIRKERKKERKKRKDRQCYIRFVVSPLGHQKRDIIGKADGGDMDAKDKIPFFCPHRRRTHAFFDKPRQPSATTPFEKRAVGAAPTTKLLGSQNNAQFFV
jgi:hypothetical protein